MIRRRRRLVPDRAVDLEPVEAPASEEAGVEGQEGAARVAAVRALKRVGRLKPAPPELEQRLKRRPASKLERKDLAADGLDSVEDPRLCRANTQSRSEQRANN